MALRRFEKDPNERLIYTLDWTLWLQGRDLDVATFEVTEVSGAEAPALIVTETSGDDDAATSWIELSGGTEGLIYRVRHQITLAGGNTEIASRSIEVFVTPR